MIADQIYTIDMTNSLPFGQARYLLPGFLSLQEIHIGAFALGAHMQYFAGSYAK